MSNTERRIAERRVEQIPGEPYRRMRIRRKCDQEAKLRDLAVPAVEASGPKTITIPSGIGVKWPREEAGEAGGTPRTDALDMQISSGRQVTWLDAQRVQMQILEHARTLERELSRLTRELEEARKNERRLRDWLDNNTTFFDVKHPVVEGHNVPTLATVSARIWYHATDDQESYPFSAVAELSGGGGEG